MKKLKLFFDQIVITQEIDNDRNIKNKRTVKPIIASLEVNDLRKLDAKPSFVDYSYGEDPKKMIYFEMEIAGAKKYLGIQGKVDVYDDPEPSSPDNTYSSES